MKFIIVAFLVISYFTVVINPAIASNSKYLCPAEIEKALSDAHLIPPTNKKAERVGPACAPIETLSYSGSEAKIINVTYGIVRDFESYSLDIPVLLLPDEKLYVLPRQFLSKWRVENFLTHELEIPFGGGEMWSNIQLDAFTDKVLIKKSSAYCIEYTFKFPFEGKVQQCANPEAITNSDKSEPYFVSGKVVYQLGVFRWKDALKKVLEECPRYKNSECKCCIGGWDGEVPTAYWGSGHSSIAIKIGYDPMPNVEYYLFNERIYRGEEENIFVQVFPDGRVKSRLIHDEVYQPAELLKMAEEAKGP